MSETYEFTIRVQVDDEGETLVGLKEGPGTGRLPQADVLVALIGFVNFVLENPRFLWNVVGKLHHDDRLDAEVLRRLSPEVKQRVLSHLPAVSRQAEGMSPTEGN